MTDDNVSVSDGLGIEDDLVIDNLFRGEWSSFLLDPTMASLGEGLFAVFVVAIVVFPLYLRTGSASMPAIVLALLSGTLIPMLPAYLIGVAWGVFWLALSIGLIGLIRNFR